VLSKRKALFKDFTRTFEPLGLVARDREPYDAAAFIASALELQRLSTLPWVYFTADGNYPPTRALPAVWAEPEAFEQAQARYQASVTRLVQAGAGRAGRCRASGGVRRAGGLQILPRPIPQGRRRRLTAAALAAQERRALLACGSHA
jgi:cytochrome c556